MPNVEGLVRKNQANVTTGHHAHNYSTFDQSLSYRFWNTLRFGDYTPSFEMEGVPTDEIELNSLDRIDSLSLNAPFKGSIRKIKESFSVPNMAILPLNWDRIYAQNTNGDDVPADANCVLSNWLGNCKTLWSNAYQILRSRLVAFQTITTASMNDIKYFYTGLLRTMVLGEFMFSKGSLVHVSGYRYGYHYFGFPVQKKQEISGVTSYLTFDRKSYDYWFDMVCNTMFSHVRSIQVYDYGTGRNRNFACLDAQNPAPSNYESFRALLELMRENPISSVVDIYFEDRFSSQTERNEFCHDLASMALDGLGPFYKEANNYSWMPLESLAASDDVTTLNPAVLNLSRVLAYQLCCAHFYTNSSIDFIYSADLYRQYVNALLNKRNYQGNPYLRYDWNGISMPYDYLSGHTLYYLLFSWVSDPAQIENFGNSIDCLGGVYGNYVRNHTLTAAWSFIFGFRKSLRYGDYFTASRPRPLAPINTDVSVNNSKVSVVDVTRNIQAQRFANAVMRSRSKVEEYVKSLFGRAPAPDYHNPFFLTRSTETIFGDEVQNTAEAQTTNPNSRTANFAANISPYTFTFHNDDAHPCVYIQIISFDIRRAYSRSVDRQMLHIDRFDMFNPDFQYIGDQAVYGIELGYDDGSKVPAIFSYQTRDMEYKQRFDVCSGGFIDDLPGWCLTDQDRSRIVISHIDPDFIRSYNTELDQFFLSLTGYSLGTYFHFTCITDNNVRAKRPMAVDPQILA